MRDKGSGDRNRIEIMDASMKEAADSMQLGLFSIAETYTDASGSSKTMAIRADESMTIYSGIPSEPYPRISSSVRSPLIGWR